MKKRFCFSCYIHGETSLDNGLLTKLHKSNLDRTNGEDDARGVDLPGPLSASIPAKLAKLIEDGAENLKVWATEADRRFYPDGHRDDYFLKFNSPEETAGSLATLARLFADVQTRSRCLALNFAWEAEDETTEGAPKE